MNLIAKLCQRKERFSFLGGVAMSRALIEKRNIWKKVALEPDPGRSKLASPLLKAEQ